ncbi:MAG: membrane integrity-associated transporter subunit PqiC [Aquabacterium sp.]
MRQPLVDATARPGSRRGRFACVAGTAAVLLLLAGCATPPGTRLHSLLPATTGGPAHMVVANLPAPAARLATLALPAAVAQPQMLVRQDDGSLLLLEHERWVAPLADELRLLLQQRLDALPASPAGAQPWQLALEVTRWEGRLGAGARLEARWDLRRDGAAAVHCGVAIDQPAGPGAAALAASHAAAAAALAQAVADSVGAATSARGCRG